MAADGAAVALTYANGAAQAADVAQGIEDKGGRTVVGHADHADPPAAARAVEQTVDQLSRLDILVNNAGIFTGGPLEQAAVQDCGEVRIRQLREAGAPAESRGLVEAARCHAELCDLYPATGGGRRPGDRHARDGRRARRDRRPGGMVLLVRPDRDPRVMATRPVWRRLAAAGRAVAVTGGLGLVFIVMTALRVIHGG